MTLLETLLAVLFAGFFISAIDDLVIDVVYWVNRLLRRHRRPPISMAELNSVPQQRAAILIPAWHEADVIREMLTFNAGVIDYDRYDFFIGTYPNDPATGERVRAAQRMLSNVYIAQTPHDGPTNKADNLNSMFVELLRQEALRGERYGFVLLHDPEDVLHPAELKLCNYYLTHSDAAMIQTPIFPLRADVRHFTAGTYMDEFAELHTKDMHVREWLSGFVPSAGVGTAIRREALTALMAANGSTPFATDSLTEDYDLGLRLAQAGSRSMFVSQHLKAPPANTPSLIATRAAFPETVKAAVRQRSRWTLGIVFQNWKNRGWKGKASVRWLLFRDRKAVATHLLIGGGYLLVLYFTVYSILQLFFFPDWPPPLPERTWIRYAFLILLFVMVHRLVQRALATSRVYGVAQGMLAIPRQIWSNLVNIRSSLRATRQFFYAEWMGVAVPWDKTHHQVPSIAATNGGRRRVGEILRGWGDISASQLQRALEEQTKSRRRIGEELVELGFINRSQLVHALRAQADEELPYSTRG